MPREVTSTCPKAWSQARVRHVSTVEHAVNESIEGLVQAQGETAKKQSEQIELLVKTVASLKEMVKASEKKA